MLNEQLYTSTGASAFDTFAQDPSLFKVYHEGFATQVCDCGGDWGGVRVRVRACFGHVMSPKTPFSPHGPVPNSYLAVH